MRIGNEDQDVIEFGDHLLAVGSHVGGGEALVEFKAFGDGEFVIHGFRFRDRNDAVLADFLHRLGDELADFGIAARDGRDGLDVRVRVNRAGSGAQFLGDRFAGFFHAGADEDGVRPFLDGRDAVMDHRLGEQGRGGRAIACHVVGLVRDFIDELGAHVLEIVLEFDFAGNRDPVVSDGWGPIALVEGDVAALGAQGQFDGVGEDVDAFDHLVAGGFAPFDFFCHDGLFLQISL